MKKPSLIERLTGSADDYSDYFDDAQPEYAAPQQQEDDSYTPPQTPAQTQDRNNDIHQWDSPLHEDEGELAVDVYQTPDAIVVKALVAGVLPNNLDISVSRDMLTIQGTRQDEREVEDDGYFQRELYWGAFSRTILLPEEVDVDAAEANEKHGILIIRLPKVNKAKQTKLRVRSK